MHKKQGNLLKGIDKKTFRREGIEPIKRDFLLSNKFFIGKQNGRKLQSFFVYLCTYNCFQK